ncbi:MAG TPA: ABC transporter ATP-binding protein [Thermoanaerobaculia bacterium]|nr:ABC transporter ATP-binding protein [Thermoanaerobaculia bacterium]
MTKPAARPETLLSVRGLARTFRPPHALLPDRTRREVPAVADVSFDLAAGETLALVGESGSGKSTTARLVLRLLAPDRGRIDFDGRDWLALPPRELRRARRDVGVVFQDPGRSLNPRMSVGAVVGEPLAIHGIGDAGERRSRVEALLAAVGLPPRSVRARPGELSTGQRQRVAIARALATAPKLVVLDEPVSALDVSIRAQVLNLLLDLQAATPSRPAYLFIGHDLGVVGRVATRTAVMYLGRIVEEGPTGEVLGSPRHPYTALLLASRPGLGDGGIPGAAERRRLAGEPASAASPPPGCPFHPRCPRASERCRTEMPGETTLPGAGGRRYSCHDPEPAAPGNFFPPSS